jgi:hypothetical protein
MKAVSAFQAGLDEREYELFVALMRRGGPAVDPVFRALLPARAALVTRTRRQVVPDNAWYRSAVFNENFRPTGIDHRLVRGAGLGRGRALRHRP